MKVTSNISARPADLELALEGWIDRSRIELRGNPDWQALYDSGVRYQREVGGREEWQTFGETRGRRFGDCEDLTIARVAELRERHGERARPHVYRTRGSLLHAVVRRANGTLEDPSRILGMGKKTMAGDTEPARSRVQVEDTAGGARARLQWRGASYVISVESTAKTRADAVDQTMQVSTQIVKGLALVAKTQPALASVIKTLLPPQAVTAIKVGGALARLAKKGGLFSKLKKLRGPALTLAKQLSE